MTGFGIDPTKLAASMAKKAGEREEEVLNRVGEIANASGVLLTLNANDIVVAACEVALGIKEGGLDKVAEILGMTAGSSSSLSGPQALTDGSNSDRSMYGDGVMFKGNRVILQIFNTDGSPTGQGCEEDDGLNNKGLVYRYENSKIVGLQPQAGGSVPTASATQSGDVEVPVWDKKGNPIRGEKIKISEGKKDKSMAAVLDDNNNVEAFQELRRTLTGRR